MRYKAKTGLEESVAYWKANRDFKRKLKESGGDLGKVLNDMYKHMPKKQRKKEADEIIRMMKQRERARQLRRN